MFDNPYFIENSTFLSLSFQPGILTHSKIIFSCYALIVCLECKYYHLWKANYNFGLKDGMVHNILCRI
jgi:hypothetical protein